MDIVGKFESKDLGDRFVAEVREHGFLKVYRDFYAYYRPKLAQRFEEGSRTTPYAESSLGRRKRRSGEVIRQVPQSKFNQDSMALYNSVVNNPKLTEEGLVIRSGVEYAPYALAHFKQKGGLAPDGVIYMDDDDLDELETILIREYLEVFP